MSGDGAVGMLACCRYSRVLTWVKAGLLTVEDVVRGATNAAMEAREASRGVMRPRRHEWGVMSWSQQVGMLACCLHTRKMQLPCQQMQQHTCQSNACWQVSCCSGRSVPVLEGCFGYNLNVLLHVQS
jgi:hypothetical protein